MNNRMKILMGAIGGASQAGAMGMVGAQGREAAELEAPYRRAEWADMVEARKQKMRADEMMARESAERQQRSIDNENRILRAEQAAEQARIAEAKFQEEVNAEWERVVLPRIQPGPGESPVDKLGKMSLPEMASLILTLDRDRHLSAHKSSKNLNESLKFLYRERMNAEEEAKRRAAGREKEFKNPYVDLSKAIGEAYQADMNLAGADVKYLERIKNGADINNMLLDENDKEGQKVARAFIARSNSMAKLRGLLASYPSEYRNALKTYGGSSGLIPPHEVVPTIRRAMTKDVSGWLEQVYNLGEEYYKKAGQ